ETDQCRDADHSKELPRAPQLALTPRLLFGQFLFFNFTMSVVQLELLSNLAVGTALLDHFREQVVAELQMGNAETLLGADQPAIHQAFDLVRGNSSLRGFLQRNRASKSRRREKPILDEGSSGRAQARE